MKKLKISVVIPTFYREQVLLNTITQLMELTESPNEILVVDQTPEHEELTTQKLEYWSENGEIKWIKRKQPSVPGAMNEGMIRASGEIVLFLDDDVIIDSKLLAAHSNTYTEDKIIIVAGKVIQPWNGKLDKNKFDAKNDSLNDPDGFQFISDEMCFVRRFSGGNFSIRRKVAIEIGGFDEQFSKVAYRFESEFSDRALRAGYKIMYQPDAEINHLHVDSGGTRFYGDTFNTIKPNHSVGRYYYLLKAKTAHNRFFKILYLPFTTLATRQNLKYPWRIPMLFIAEILGLGWACIKIAQGPKRIQRNLGTGL